MTALERAKKDIYIEQVITQDLAEYEKTIIEISQNHDVVDTEFDRHGDTLVYRAWCRKN